MKILEELTRWIAALDPAAAFLFALPFLVAAAGLARSWFDDRAGRAPPIPRDHVGPATRARR